MQYPDKSYDVIIIGSGPNGLTAASYLSRAGAKILLLERRHETGGGLVTEEFSGFRFNLHAIYMMMMDVTPVYTDLELEGRGCVYVKPEAQATLLMKDGRALTLYSDLEASVESIKKFSKKDAERFREVYKECKDMADASLIPGTYTLAVPAADYTEMLSQTEVGKKILEVSELTPYDIMKTWGFETPQLNALMLYLVCMWGLDPDSTASTFLVPLYFNRMLNVSFIKGGTHRLSSALHKAAVKASIDVLENHEVTRIIVEDGVAKGVEVAVTGQPDKVEKYEAKVIVTSTDPVMTFGKLIPDMEKYSRMTAATAKRWEWEHSSFYGLHMAVQESPKFKASEFDPAVGKALIKVIGIETPEEVVKHYKNIEEGILDDCGHITVMTELDPGQAPQHTDPGSGVVRYETTVPYETKDGTWDQIGNKYGDRLVAKLKEYTTNFDETRIIRRYDYSPMYIEQKLVNMQRGSFKHGAYVTTQMGYNRPNLECSHYKTPIKNLYVCGASTYPGGAVIFGGGYNVAAVVCEDMGLKKWWSDPDYVVTARERKLAL